ncbi:N-acylethanolamine-hydrolyzing acid amidase-like [Dysidea avara]|uniref:N-acylethanolamine-hydrolyzing acid amidase-like n=1 Tax=Dysidea avara TaxID=196820 RepID=UPI00332FACA5
MKSLAVLVLIIAALIAAIAESAHPRSVKSYNINLDAAPETRWNEVVDDFAEFFPELIPAIKQYVPGEVLPLLDVVGDSVDTYLPEPYAAEILGIGQRSKTSVGEIAILNILYDLLAGCTSIVAEDEEGRIYHARNLDYQLTQILQNITLVANFQRGGRTVYTGTTYAGYTGLLTGQRPYVFSVSLDQRDAGKHWMNAATALLAKNASIVSFLIRNTLENVQSYKEALDILSHTTFIAPSYIIIAGTKSGEGAVITRDRITARDVWTLDPPERWFLVETNYDHWEPPPKDDDRRDPANQHMNKIGRQNISLDELFSVLKTPPVLNNSTTYTTLMCAAVPNNYATWAW